MRVAMSRAYARKLFVTAGLFACAVAGLSCSPPNPEVSVLLTDYAFDPPIVTLQRAQKTIIKLQNKGSVEHNLAIPRQNISSVIVKPGETASLELAFPQGEFPIVCSLPGHEDQGMVGKISATRAK